MTRLPAKRIREIIESVDRSVRRRNRKVYVPINDMIAILLEITTTRTQGESGNDVG